MIGQIRPQDKVMAMDRSTIWPYFPRFLIARPQFLRFWRACTAFMPNAEWRRQIEYKLQSWQQCTLSSKEHLTITIIFHGTSG